MKGFILGLALGLLLGASAIGFASMAGGRQGREYDKFIETTGGKTSVLVTIVN